MNSGAEKVSIAQFIFTAAGGIFFYFYQGELAAESALYGGCIALFNVWVANRHLRSAMEIAKVAPGKEVTVLYIGIIVRFVSTLVFFVVGMAVLKLPPAPLLATFALAQVGYLFIGQKTITPTNTGV